MPAPPSPTIYRSNAELTLHGDLHPEEHAGKNSRIQIGAHTYQICLASPDSTQQGAFYLPIGSQPVAITRQSLSFFSEDMQPEAKAVYALFLKAQDIAHRRAAHVSGTVSVPQTSGSNTSVSTLRDQLSDTLSVQHTVHTKWWAQKTTHTTTHTGTTGVHGAEGGTGAPSPQEQTLIKPKKLTGVDPFTGKPRGAQSSSIHFPPQLPSTSGTSSTAGPTEPTHQPSTWQPQVPTAQRPAPVPLAGSHTPPARPVPTQAPSAPSASPQPPKSSGHQSRRPVQTQMRHAQPQPSPQSLPQPRPQTSAAHPQTEDKSAQTAGETRYVSSIYFDINQPSQAGSGTTAPSSQPPTVVTQPAQPLPQPRPQQPPSVHAPSPTGRPTTSTSPTGIPTPAPVAPVTQPRPRPMGSTGTLALFNRMRPGQHKPDPIPTVFLPKASTKPTPKRPTHLALHPTGFQPVQQPQPPLSRPAPATSGHPYSLSSGHPYSQRPVSGHPQSGQPPAQQSSTSSGQPSSGQPHSPTHLPFTAVSPVSGHPKSGIGHPQSGIGHPQSGVGHPQSGVGQPQSQPPSSGYPSTSGQPQTVPQTEPQPQGHAPRYSPLYSSSGSGSVSPPSSQSLGLPQSPSTPTSPTSPIVFDPVPSPTGPAETEFNIRIAAAYEPHPENPNAPMPTLGQVASQLMGAGVQVMQLPSGQLRLAFIPANQNPEAILQPEHWTSQRPPE